jgi:DNA-binding transcriptional ArsR family regulator
MPYSSTEIDARVKQLGARLRAADQATADPTVRIRKVDPAELLRPAPPTCEKCGVELPDGPIHTCAARPAAQVVQLRPTASVRRGPHLSHRDRRRVLDWLAEHGPATARMVAWALDLDRREVNLLLAGLEGGRVEKVGVLDMGRRGHPPALWRIREAIAA